MGWLMLLILFVALAFLVMALLRQAEKADKPHDSIVGVGESVVHRLPRTD
jgi:cell division protein FtsW (lipid II flippase)